MKLIWESTTYFMLVNSKFYIGNHKYINDINLGSRMIRVNHQLK